MKTSPVTPDDLWKSVIAVPPLCRNNDGALRRDQNARLVDYMAKGGVKTCLWGGNANLYNVGVTEYAGLLDQIEDIAQADSWMIPSVGADYGKACDQIDLLKARDFPTAMVLPLVFPATPEGVATGLRRLADRYGKPLIAYIKSENYLTPADAGALASDGVLSFIKYANVRSDPADDPFLQDLLVQVDPALIVSGIGERPVLTHLQDFGLTGFTSGSVCVAPRMSSAILRLLKQGDIKTAAGLRAAFLPLEDLRDGHSPIRVLHHAVAAAGIAETGPFTSFLSEIEDAALQQRIRAAAQALAAEDTRATLAA